MTTHLTDIHPRSARAVLREWSANPRRAVIFDFNGTLSDDEPILLEIFTGIFRSHLGWQLTPEHYRDNLLGRSDREIVEIVVAEHGVGDRESLTDLLLAERRSRYKERVSEQSPVSAGATALVRRLADSGVPMAVVTGAQREDVLAVLDHCEAGRHLDVLVAEEDVERGKPDPEGFLRGAALLDREPGEILVFEDSVPGVVGAVRGGMHCIAVSGTGTDPQLAAVAPALVPALGEELLTATDL
jgi:HAD superfamily hydrolase (TIGR01509 family)